MDDSSLDYSNNEKTHHDKNWNEISRQKNNDIEESDKVASSIVEPIQEPTASSNNNDNVQAKGMQVQSIHQLESLNDQNQVNDINPMSQEKLRNVTPTDQQSQVRQQNVKAISSSVGDNKREDPHSSSNETNGNNFLHYLHQQNEISDVGVPKSSSLPSHALESSFFSDSRNQQQQNQNVKSKNVNQDTATNTANSSSQHHHQQQQLFPPRPMTLTSSLRNTQREATIGTSSPSERGHTNTVQSMLERGHPAARNRRTVSWDDTLSNNDTRKEQRQQLQNRFIQDQQQQLQRSYDDADKASPPVIASQGEHNQTESEITNFSNLQEGMKLEDTKHHDSPKTIENPIVLPKSIDLNDVIKSSPLETEAETLIMQSVLAREKATSTISSKSVDNRHQRFVTPSSILSSVTIEGASIFTEKSNENIDDKSSIISNSDDIMKKPKTLKGRTSTESSHAAPSSHPQEIRRGLTTGRQHAREKGTHHHRNPTMHRTLAGLSKAIAGISTVPSPIGSSPSEQHQRFDKNSDDDDDDYDNENNNKGVAETLARNAKLIYRGYKTNNKEGRAKLTTITASPTTSNTVPSSNSSPSTYGNRNWNVLRNAVMSDKPQLGADTHMHDGSLESRKKNDNIVIDIDDEEMTEHEELSNSKKEVSSPRYDPSSPLSMEQNDNENSHEALWKDGKFNCCQYMLLSIFHFGKDFRVFTRQRRGELVTYLRLLLLFVCPATGIAFILFYLAGNPPTGRKDINDTNTTTSSRKLLNIDELNEASASWWILFICVRQAFTFTLSRAMQTFVIDFLCLSTRTMVNVFGNLITLLIVQSKGWPFLLFMWALFDYVLLYGAGPFVQHWLYWQDILGIFNAENPSGSVTSNEWNRTILTIAMVLSVLVAIKLLWLGLFLGRKTYANYAEDLSKIMTKILCLCEVAALARDVKVDSESKGHAIISNLGMTKASFDGFVQEAAEEFDHADDYSFSKDVDMPSSSGARQANLLIDPHDLDKNSGGLSPSQKMKLNELLGAWECPEEVLGVEDNPSISAILQFRHSLSLIDNQFMFSLAWGDVGWRDRMVLSSQTVYKNLLRRTPGNNVLSFEVLALSANGHDGTLDHEKLKCLIRLFRPDRDGNLSLLDFVKSVDTVYKEAKFFRASVANSEKIDLAFERAVNAIFYTVFLCATLSQVGYDPLALFLSLSSIILAFAFMIGTASAKMFEGFLLILMRRPYDIGDRIHISNIESDTDTDGSLGWLVKDVDLFTTTVIYGATNEIATLSNGSIASSRIINMARSKKASVSIKSKYSTDVPFEKVQLFEDALRKFVKARPREWANFSAFRALTVMPDLGYIEYVTVLQHRDSWQNIGNILTSKAQVYSFTLELANNLDMRYKSPPLPVDLAFTTSKNTTTQTAGNKNGLNKTLPFDESCTEEVAAIFDVRK